MSHTRSDRRSFGVNGQRTRDRSRGRLGTHQVSAGTSIAETDDDPERFRELGVDLFEGTARVTGYRKVTVETADGRHTRTRHPIHPRSAPAAVRRSRPSPAWARSIISPARTCSNSTVRRRRLVMIGGGPIACENGTIDGAPRGARPRWSRWRTGWSRATNPNWPTGSARPARRGRRPAPLHVGDRMRRPSGRRRRRASSWRPPTVSSPPRASSSPPADTPMSRRSASTNSASRSVHGAPRSTAATARWSRASTSWATPPPVVPGSPTRPPTTRCSPSATCSSPAAAHQRTSCRGAPSPSPNWPMSD